MFSPESAQKRGRANRVEVKKKPPTAEELAESAKEEIAMILNLLDGWFLAAHHTRVDKQMRDTTDAVLEEARKKIKAVK
jgi:gas vesicle protein